MESPSTSTPTQWRTTRSMPNNRVTPSPIAASYEESSRDASRSQFLMGLTIAGMASTLLSTVFGLFNVDMFLRVYELPLSTYATGTFVFSIINTANDVAGAWLVDAFASQSARSSIIGLSGCIFAVCFLAPFFRWQSQRGLWDGFHFVLSMSLYDSLFSFTSILVGSVVTDDHTMSDHARVRFMASGKVVNLVASFLVARLGLELFSDDQSDEDLKAFRYFLVALCLLACVLFLIAQLMMTPGTIVPSWPSTPHHRRVLKRTSSDFGNESSKSKLRLRQVIRDFLKHDNFRAWIGMEMFLECQHNFVMSFLKTFVDRLVVDAGFSEETGDWMLSLVQPLKEIAGILCYVPIRRMGYHKVYTWMFRANFVLSLLTLACASPSNPYSIMLFVLIHTIMTGAVQSAGFHLAMSDMVLEMKRMHAGEGRFDEPSLAGLFMGANTLLCKPMESVLPILAAYFLERTDFSTNEESEEARWVLFYLLVVPPVVFSCLQLLSWRRYNLHPERTDRMRQELRSLIASTETNQVAKLVL